MFVVTGARDLKNTHVVMRLRFNVRITPGRMDSMDD